MCRFCTLLFLSSSCSVNKFLTCLAFKLNEIDQRGLRAFDLRRQDGFLANEGIDQPLRGRNHLRSELEPAQRLFGCAQPLPENSLDPNGRGLHR